jgi:hypothetical protein
MTKNEIVDKIKSNEKQEQIFEDMKSWYNDNGITSYYIDIEEHSSDENIMYNIVNYCEIKRMSKAKDTEIMTKAFEYFIELCEKYDVYTDYKWLSTMIFNVSVENLFSGDFLDAFCKIESEKIKGRCGVKELQNNSTFLVIFEDDNSMEKYIDSSEFKDLKLEILNDFGNYIKEKNVNVNLEIYFNYMVEL